MLLSNASQPSAVTKEQISLVLKVSNCTLSGIVVLLLQQLGSNEVPMEDSSKVIFYYMQKLLLKLISDKEKSKRVWDHTFT